MEEILVNVKGEKREIGSIARKHSRSVFHVSRVLNMQQALMLIA